MSISLEQVETMQVELFARAAAIVKTKGHDYNRAQQESGDTLFNLRVASLLGIVDSPAKSVLVRLGDKFMRLVSLADPGVEAKVKDESVRDTVIDVINYITYFYLFWLEAKKAKEEPEVSPVLESVAVLESLGINGGVTL